jgi:hypothetical protein
LVDTSTRAAVRGPAHSGELDSAGARSGVDVQTVAARLGHADRALTLRVYASFMEEQDRKAADIMGGVLKPGAA